MPPTKKKKMVKPEVQSAAAAAAAAVAVDVEKTKLLAAAALMDLERPDPSLALCESARGGEAFTLRPRSDPPETPPIPTERQEEERAEEDPTTTEGGGGQTGRRRRPRSIPILGGSSLRVGARNAVRVPPLRDIGPTGGKGGSEGGRGMGRLEEENVRRAPPVREGGVRRGLRGQDRDGRGRVRLGGYDPSPPRGAAEGRGG